MTSALRVPFLRSSRSMFSVEMSHRVWAGPGIAPLRYSKTDHSGFGGLQMGKVQGGKQLLFGPVYTTDDGSGAIQQTTTTQPAPPESGIPS